MQDLTTWLCLRLISELSEEDTPHAIAPSRPNHQLNTLVMPDTDSNSSDNGTDGSDTEDERTLIKALLCHKPIVRATVR